MIISKRIKEHKGKFISLEFFPPKERETWPEFFAVVQQLKVLGPLFASVTYGAGGGTQENTLDVVAKIKAEFGLEPMAHLTCVAADEEHIFNFLQKLDKAGVSNVLALRGDRPKDDPNYDFSQQVFTGSIDLVRFIKKHFPQIGIAGTGYPEPHPETLSIAAGLDWAKAKVDAGAEFLVTQLFFDNRLYFDFVERLHKRACHVPVLPGILPIMSLASAKFILSLCGAAIPGKFLSALEKAHAGGGDEEVRRIGLDYATRQAQELLDRGACGVHLYTLNKAQACLEIGQNLSLS